MDIKKIIKETINYDEEIPANSQRVNIQIVMDRVPIHIQKEIENDFNAFFEKIVKLVPDTYHTIRPLERELYQHGALL